MLGEVNTHEEQHISPSCMSAETWKKYYGQAMVETIVDTFLFQAHIWMFLFGDDVMNQFIFS